MRIALAQYRPADNLDSALLMAVAACEAAAAGGAGLICFNQFFLGLIDQKYDARVIKSLSDTARRLQLAIVTGNIIIDENSCEASSAYFDAEGNLAAFEPEKTGACGWHKPITLFETPLGPLLVLSELEAYDSGIEPVIRELKPKVILMQVSPISLLELEAIKELTIQRSYNQAHLVLTAAIVGDFAGGRYIGGSMAVLQGRIIGEGAVDAVDLLIVDADLGQTVDYQTLRETVAIPELLRQKLLHESRVKDGAGRGEELR